MQNIIWSSTHQLKFENIISADNCFLYDNNGNKYIDLESGVWCTNIGHNNKKIRSTLINQINNIIHTGFCYSNPLIEEAACKVLKITDLKNGKCEFLCSGSEAVEYGMRAARAVTNKPLALTFTDSYFGAYGDAAVKNKETWHLYDWLKCSCNSKEGCIGECKEFRGIPFDKISIFLFEPGSSSGLVRFPSNKLITQIVDRIRAGNGIVMANEITTGTGRTGKWFGYQHYSFKPDIVAVGKGIGNGYPVSVTAVSQSVAEKLDIHMFRYSQSHQNDPLGAAVVSEVIAVINDEDLLAEAVKKSTVLMTKLLTLKNEYSIIRDVRGRGFMIALEFNSHSAFVYEELLKRRFIVAKRPNAEVLRLDPALTVEQSTLDLFTDTLKEVFEELKQTNI